MFRIYLLLCCFVVIHSQQVIQEEGHPAPEPYNFAYSASNEDGSSSSREEIGDANGRITGFYTLVGLDGQERRVDYVADENGFRAKVTTNEIGTESKDTADAEYLSSAPSTDQLRAEWEASQSRLQGVKTSINTQQTLIGSQAILPPSKVVTSTKTQTVSGVSDGLGVSLVGSVPSVGGSIFTRTKSVKTQSSGNLGVSAIRVAQPVQEITRTVQTQSSGNLNGISGIRFAQQPVQEITRTVQTQSSGNLNGISGIRFAQQPVQEFTRTVQTQSSNGLGSGGGFSIINLGSQAPRVSTGGGLSIAGISSPSGSTRVSTIQSQQLGTKGVSGGGGGLSIVGISPSSRGISRTQTIRTQTIGGSPSAQSVDDISSLLAQQNNGLQGLQGLSLSGLQIIPAGNPLVRYLSSGTGEVFKGYNNNQGNIILLPEDLNLEALQSQNSQEN